MANFSQLLKKGAYVMAALVLAGSTLAFKAAQTEYNWYAADEGTGMITTPIDVNAVCTDAGELCAVGFSRDHYNLQPNDPAPITSLDDLEDESPSNYQTAEKPLTR